MQHRGCLIEGDDAAVRQLLLAQPTGCKIRKLDLKFSGTGGKRAGGGDVPARAEAIGVAQTGQLIGALHGAREIQAQDKLARIGSCAPGCNRLVRRADECGAA